MAEMGFYLWGSSDLDYPAQEESPRASCSRSCPDNFWISSRIEVTTLGNLCQRSVTQTMQKCFLIFKKNVMCFILCLLSYLSFFKNLNTILWDGIKGRKIPQNYSNSPDCFQTINNSLFIYRIFLPLLPSFKVFGFISSIEMKFWTLPDW